jgi:hypothetical protein
MKHIWDLTEEDFNKNPVWYFPMEGEDTDETSVLPASEREATNLNNMLLVPATFKESNGGEHKGFIYWAKPKIIENLQPCMFYGSGAVTFWFGIVEPEAEDMKQLNFPITVSSYVVYGLEKIEKEIEGYYFINQAGDVEVKHVAS